MVVGVVIFTFAGEFENIWREIVVYLDDVILLDGVEAISEQ